MPIFSIAMPLANRISCFICGKSQTKKQKLNFTTIAHLALDGMHTAGTVTTNAVWDMQRADAAFEDSNPNTEYNSRAWQYLESLALCQIVNAYQWYNNQVFKLLAQIDPTAFHRFKDSANLRPADIERIAKGEPPVAILAERISFNDSVVRKHLHTTLGIWEESEMSILVEIRNCITHHLGKDHQHKVENWLESGSSPWQLKPLIAVFDGFIHFFRDSHRVVQTIGLAQISIFDQVVAKRFNLPVSPYNAPTLQRSVMG